MNNEIVSFRNRFLCKSCKKLLITKEALDNHIIICYESRLEKQRDEYKTEFDKIKKDYEETIEKINKEHEEKIDKIKKDYEEKIDEIVEYMTNHINTIEHKHISLNNYLIEQVKKLSSL
jgi:gas vesicle protein